MDTDAQSASTTISSLKGSYSVATNADIHIRRLIMIKTIIIAVVVTLFTFLWLVSCTPYITEGEIISKEYKPQRMWVTYMYVNKMLIPQTHVSPEAYIIRIRGIVNGKEVINERNVPAYLYEKLSIGEWWRDSFMN